MSPDLNTDFSCPHFVFRYLKVSTQDFRHYQYHATQDFRHYQYQVYKFLYFFNDAIFEARNFGCFLKCTLKYQVICARLSQKFKQNSIIFGCYFHKCKIVSTVFVAIMNRRIIVFTDAVNKLLTW